MIDQKEASLPWQPQTWNKAKSKNHTNHNQNRKHHRNPTRKPNTKQKIKIGNGPQIFEEPQVCQKAQHEQNPIS